MDAFGITCITIIVIMGMILVLSYYVEHKELKEKEDKYNVSKYPVVSKMGNKYYAEVKYKHDNFWGDSIYCNVYTREIKENEKYKDKLIVSERVNFESFDYNYIDVITHCIKTYEEEHRKELEFNKYEEEQIKKNKQEFNSWDGVIK